MCHKILRFIVFYRNLDMKILSASCRCWEVLSIFIFMTGKMLAKRDFVLKAHKKSAVNLKFLNQAAILRENNEKVLKFNLIKQFHRLFFVGSVFKLCHLNEISWQVWSLLWYQIVWIRKLPKIWLRQDETYECLRLKKHFLLNENIAFFSSVCYWISLCFIHILAGIRNSFAKRAVFQHAVERKYQ